MGEYMKEDGFDFDNVIFKMRKQDWEHYDWNNVPLLEIVSKEDSG